VECDVAVPIAVRGPNLFVFAFVGGRHVPVEAVAEAGGVVVVVFVWSLKLGRCAAEGGGGGDEVLF